VKHKIEVEFDDQSSALKAGFRMDWINGEDSKSKVHLGCGAGCGSPYMVFSLTDKKSNQALYAVADIRPMVNELARVLRATLDANRKDVASAAPSA
jgi:hypothetical protein